VDGLRQKTAKNLYFLGLLGLHSSIIGSYARATLADGRMKHIIIQLNVSYVPKPISCLQSQFLVLQSSGGPFTTITASKISKISSLLLEHILLTYSR